MTSRLEAEALLCAQFSRYADYLGVDSATLSASPLALIACYDAMEQSDRDAIMDIGRTMAIAGYIKRGNIAELNRDIERIEKGDL